VNGGLKQGFRVGDREVGPSARCLIIAEAGVSHFGDMTLARELVDLAAESGADVFKTQFFDVDSLIASRASDWRDRLRPRNLTLDDALELKSRCDGKGILFMSTAHDATRIEWLRRLEVPAVKVGSGERNNPDFLRALAVLGKPMIVSTGMYGELDVREAVQACRSGGCTELALLHCVTAYPAPPADINLRAMARLAEIFPGPVGYSDHTEDFLAVYAAVARGARIIEKHITILRDVPNAHDWKVSAGPENLKQLVEDIRRIEVMLGHGRKEPAPSDLAGARWATKSLVAARDLPAGHVLCSDDLVAKRPGDGLPPNRIFEILGRRLTRPIGADEPIQPDDCA
jgi:N-acetylneuraminate synthase/N,N'-diacetyllegionaminate synthase